MADDEDMQNVTLIGMYSCMLLNEICALRVANIREIEGGYVSKWREWEDQISSPCYSVA